MGYSTRFNLNVDFVIGGKVAKLVDDAPLLEVIKELRESIEEAHSALDEDGNSSGEGCKWYEHTAEMMDFSRNHPGVLFTLSGEGEESADLWKEYYLNGKVQVEKAQVQIAPFDPSKLK